MHITQWGEYGTHCALFIALKQREGIVTVRASEIAEAQNIPLDYAQQILQRLRRKAIVKSVRGPQGGYQLNRKPQEITLFDILTAAEGETFEVICDSKPLSADRCAPNVMCNLRPIWFALRDHVNSFLTKYTLDDLMNKHVALNDAPIKIGQR